LNASLFKKGLSENSSNDMVGVVKWRKANLLKKGLEENVSTFEFDNLIL